MYYKNEQKIKFNITKGHHNTIIAKNNKFIIIIKVYPKFTPILICIFSFSINTNIIEYINEKTQNIK